MIVLFVTKVHSEAPAIDLMANTVIAVKNLTYILEATLTI